MNYVAVTVLGPETRGSGGPASCPKRTAVRGLYVVLEDLSSGFPFASAWGLMKVILLALEPSFPRSLMNTNSYSFYVVIIKTRVKIFKIPGEREIGWHLDGQEGYISHLFQDQKSCCCSRMDPPSQTRFTNQCYLFICSRSLS